MILPRLPRSARASIILGLCAGMALTFGQLGAMPGGAKNAQAAPFTSRARPTPSKQDFARTAHPPIHVRRNATLAPTGYSPAQARHAYTFDQLTASGAGQIIGIIDAYDDPTAAGDLQTFISAYGLPTMHGLPNTGSCSVSAGPHPCFQKVYAQGVRPGTDSGWALEMSLDVQWAHAIAQGADILLVEAYDNTFQNLFGAINAAVNDGASAVSMSWGGGEFAGESSFDSYFDHAGVSFTASAGDSGTGVLYPAASPFVIGVGGTTLPLDGMGNLLGPETAWSGSGGGIASYETEPPFQSNYPIPSTGGQRGVPDVSYDADPNTGFSVYDSTSYYGQAGWFQVGGTSAGAPQWAGLIALANQVGGRALSSSNPNSSPEYSAAVGSLYVTDYRDITSGSNGSCGAVCAAGMGYDFITGLGSPLASQLAGNLSNPGAPTATPTSSPTGSPTVTNTPSPTATSTSTPVATVTATATAKATATSTPAASMTPTATATAKSTATSTPTAASTPTSTVTTSSGPVGPGTYAGTSPSVKAPGWSIAAGSVIRDAVAFQTASLSFTGSQITYTYWTAPNGGYVFVAIDGQIIDAFDAYSASTVTGQARSYSVSSGTHTIAVESAGISDGLSTGTFAYLQSFTVS